MLGELVVSTVPLAMALTLGTSWDVAKVLDMVHAMNGLAVTSKVCFAPERLSTVAKGTEKGLGSKSKLLLLSRLN